MPNLPIFTQSQLFQQLNQQQQQAVLSLAERQMIIAGPGTGKTQTLIAKVLHLLLSEKVEARQLAVLTFTNKAAQELRQRLTQQWSELTQCQPGQAAAQLPFVGTFHALALNLLKKFLPDQEWRIIPPLQRQILIKQLLAEAKTQKSAHSLAYSLKEFDLILSRYKNLSLVATELSSSIVHLIERYQTKLEEKQYLDYDDLLIQAEQLPLADKDKFSYLLVDEYQDINQRQYQLVKKLLTKLGKLTVIGDPQQAIYAFRGATPQAFIDFQSDFPQAETSYLLKNYRNRQQIINLAQALLPPVQPQQVAKIEAAQVELIKTHNEFSEADFVVQKIEELTGGVNMLQASDYHQQEQRYSFADFAVIYRSHHLSRLLKDKLNDSGIPYQVVGNHSFFAQPAMQLLFSCLRLLKSDKAFEESLLPEQLQQAQVIVEQLKQHFEQPVSSIKLEKLVTALVELLKLKEQFAQKPDYQKQLYQFLTLLPSFESAPDSLTALLAYFDQLVGNDFYDAQAQQVTLLTMHAAKGLEFPVVFICGFEQGQIPLQRAEKLEPEHLAEEKRLFYVALTRAEAQLYLLNAKRRYKKKTQLSPFAKSFNQADFQEVIDPAMIKREKKLAKQRQAKAQLGLFS